MYVSCPGLLDIDTTKCINLLTTLATIGFSSAHGLQNRLQEYVCSPACAV